MASLGSHLFLLGAISRREFGLQVLLQFADPATAHHVRVWKCRGFAEPGRVPVMEAAMSIRELAPPSCMVSGPTYLGRVTPDRRKHLGIGGETVEPAGGLYHVHIGPLPTRPLDDLLQCGNHFRDMLKRRIGPECVAEVKSQMVLRVRLRVKGPELLAESRQGVRGWARRPWHNVPPRFQEGKEKVQSLPLEWFTCGLMPVPAKDLSHPRDQLRRGIELEFPGLSAAGTIEGIEGADLHTLGYGLCKAHGLVAQCVPYVP